MNQYYLYILIKNGISELSAIIEYPKLRQQQIEEWDLDDLQTVEGWIALAKKVIHQSNCPDLIKKPICKKCSYYNFCYATESDSNGIN
ncbi:Dna2/Cas4 domain-containing protein [Aquiflexum sp.]|uniref:Dna2/Cas4 domain-containing protein n=1 Tax=Aquiflexum sp. TaxID=1872584 RepID=UPI0035946FF9